MTTERVPWKESNLALIGSDLDHKIKAAAAAGEPQWDGIGKAPALMVWRIEQFRVVPWPVGQYGKFHTGDSYIVLNSYTKDSSDTLYHDLHFWIGTESSQDEYGTAAYKTVEADEALGGAAIQHREVQGNESPLFQSYFKQVTYLEGGTATGFTHVEPTKDQPHLFRIKGTQKGMSLTQLGLSKSSLNKGDSFVLFANPSLVWIWHGMSANPDEKNKANTIGESMCTEGTVVVMEQGSGDEEVADFWAYLADGEIQEADDKDSQVKEFAPILFKLPGDPDATPVEVAKAHQVVARFGPSHPKLSRSSLDENDIFLLDAGWEIMVWTGKNSDRSEKLAAMTKAHKYCSADPRTDVLPFTMVKSGFEGPDFLQYFE